MYNGRLRRWQGKKSKEGILFLNFVLMPLLNTKLSFEGEFEMHLAENAPEQLLGGREGKSSVFHITIKPAS